MKTFDQWVQLQESDLPSGQLGPRMVGDPNFVKEPINPMDDLKKLLRTVKSKPALYDMLMQHYGQHKDAAKTVAYARAPGPHGLGLSGNKIDRLASGGKPLRSPVAPPRPKSPYKAALLRGRKAEEEGGRNPFGG